MTATPPPLPVVRGLWMMEKFGGVRELRVIGSVSGESQVSERDRISMSWSVMNSLRRVGLSRVVVIEVAEAMFRWASWSEMELGPGLRWISPQSMSRRVSSRLCAL